MKTLLVSSSISEGIRKADCFLRFAMKVYKVFDLGPSDVLIKTCKYAYLDLPRGTKEMGIRVPLNNPLGFKHPPLWRVLVVNLSW